MRFSPGYGVMEKRQFGIPETNVGYSENLDRAKELADLGVWRRVVEMWKEGGTWHFGEEHYIIASFGRDVMLIARTGGCVRGR